MSKLTSSGTTPMYHSLFERLPEVVKRIAVAPSLAIFVTCDGALVPISEGATPELSPTTRQILRSLAEDEHVVLGIFSGRELLDLERLIGIADVVYAGKHGFEIRGRGCSRSEPTLGPREAVHEPQPSTAWNKAAALRWIIDQLHLQDALTIYLGADPTDADAFAAIGDGITVLVGDAADSSARYRLKDATDVQRFLAWLLDRVAERFIAMAHSIEPVYVNQSV